MNAAIVRLEMHEEIMSQRIDILLAEGKDEEAKEVQQDLAEIRQALDVIRPPL